MNTLLNLFYGAAMLGFFGAMILSVGFLVWWAIKVLRGTRDE